MTKQTQCSECPGCKITLPKTGYPADNRYGVASAECRQMFDEIIVKESEFGHSVHRLVVDAYCVQHPPLHAIQRELGIPRRFIDASIQSIAIHLIALHLAFEKKIPLQNIASHMDSVLTYMKQHNRTFEELTPPADLSSIRSADVRNGIYVPTTTQNKYEQAVWEWAESAWHAWQQHHDKVRFWYKEYSV